MKNKRCLYCYQLLSENEIDFHSRCSSKMFSTAVPPVLEYSKDSMEEIARQIILRSVAVTGVQSKLALTIEPQPGDPKRSRFTIVGLWGGYILKPPSSEFPSLPENEDLTMHLATIFGIATAEHALIRLASNELAYITKRFDRVGNEKLAMEDMCQLTETLTDDKYRGSMEKIGKYIERFSSQPGLDKITFFEMALFSFLTGNADMHLKNFSLLTSKDNLVQLSPAYDMLNTKLALPKDTEELALTLNAKKRKLSQSDFNRFGLALNIPENVLNRTYSRFAKQLNVAINFIKISFLSPKEQKAYTTLLQERAVRAGIS
ncbi:HipA domain-containing protein [Longitalea luteola]|uniref:HipA domain-containing protein n=1 Tax=Longitalea luteola TaxID=2812563 RepID=UPI001A961275|nr:HipA domain-containing protein [Longitalea luteola]